MGPSAGSRIHEPHRLHRAEEEGFGPLRREHLDGLARLEHSLLLEIPRRNRLAAGERLEKTVELLPRHGAIQVIRPPLVVAGSLEGNGAVDGIPFHDGGHGVVEVKALPPPSVPPNFLRQVRRRSAGRWPRWRDDPGEFEAASSRTISIPLAGLHELGHSPGKLPTVHGQRLPRRNAVTRWAAASTTEPRRRSSSCKSPEACAIPSLLNELEQTSSAKSGLR